MCLNTKTSKSSNTSNTSNTSTHPTIPKLLSLSKHPFKAIYFFLALVLAACFLVALAALTGFFLAPSLAGGPSASAAISVCSFLRT